MLCVKHKQRVCGVFVFSQFRRYGLSEWLEIGVDERIFLHTYWYHHCVRTCFFVVDFSLRLLTVTLLLHEAKFRWGAFLLLAAVALMYVIAMSFYTKDPFTLLKSFCLTFFINLIPAELRKREGRERFRLSLIHI